MNAYKYPEIKPGMKIIKKVYVFILLLVFGRAFQAASRVDRGAKDEFAAMPDDFMLDLCVLPNGPHMIVGKNEKGRIKYFGWNPAGKKITLFMKVKSLESAIQMFTFQESSCVATSRDRLIVDGDLPVACGVLRLMDLLEVLLLPSIVAKLGVKRYPKWSQMNPFRKWVSRVLVYVRLVTG